MIEDRTGIGGLIKERIARFRRIFVHKLSAKEISVGTIKEKVSGSGITFDDSLQAAGSFGTSLAAISSNTTLDGTHHAVICDASGGAFTVTLPAASGITGRIYHVKKTDSSGNAVTVDGNASETIDGGTTAALSAQYESVMIICTGSEWFVI